MRHFFRLRRISAIAGFALLVANGRADSATSTPPPTAEEQMLRAIYSEALVRGEAFENLRSLVTRYPGRLAGSRSLAGAITWVQATLATVKPDRVYTQDVMVPHWERGAPESVLFLDEMGVVPLTATALGGSGPSPAGGVMAKVIEVRSLAELATLGRAELEGKIVFFNRPMDPSSVRPGPAYGGAGDQRSRGPAAAAKYGAVGALVRSLTQRQDDIPHTGVTIYPADVPKIPAAALSTNAADRLSAAIAAAKQKGTALLVGMKIYSQWHPDAPSHNVIAEIRGSEFPNEIIVVGGHTDSWDIAPGAHDDGAGIVQSIEVLRIFRALGIKPRHTLRCVAFVNEENGSAGAKAYAKAAAAAGEKHLLAVESDAGGFEPHSITLASTTGDAADRVNRWLPLFRRYGTFEFRNGDAGVDVTPLVAQGAIAGEMNNDSQRYFDLHHTRIDDLDQVNPRELQLGAAALASFIWLADTQGL